MHSRHVGRQRNLGGVELAVLQHALVAVRAIPQATLLADLQHLQIEAGRQLDGAVVERHQSIVTVNGEGNGH